MSCNKCFWRGYTVLGIASSSYLAPDIGEKYRSGKIGFWNAYALQTLSGVVWPVFLPLFLGMKQRGEI
ncbi:putative membrane protein [Lausannevirus]|uniref:Putative membrane protein n=1 Tax=Lausannevirus TaxID=999883 RepID=F2WL35_9VIRU|nr:hypothetical protein LAU_0106 [Lausannevirus]AEA06958.1 putative membrane protein [Lausannevirus]